MLSPWHLELPEFQKLQQASREYTYKPGVTLYCPDTVQEDVLIIKSGRLRPYLVSSQGKELCFTVFGPGTMLCEYVLFGQEPLQTFAESLEQVVVYRIKKRLMEDLLRSYHHLMLTAYKAMSAKMNLIMNCLNVLVLENVETRIIWALNRIADQSGATEEPFSKISVTTTHEKLASMIGTSRSAVTQCLDAMAAAGMISMSRGKIVFQPSEPSFRSCHELV